MPSRSFFPPQAQMWKIILMSMNVSLIGYSVYLLQNAKTYSLIKPLCVFKLAQETEIMDITHFLQYPAINGKSSHSRR